MEEDDNMPGLASSDTSDDDTDEDKDIPPALVSTDDGSGSDSDNEETSCLGTAKTGDLTIKEIAKKWVAEFSKGYRKATGFPEVMKVLKIKIFGPIVFGLEEDLKTPWINAMLKFGLTQDPRKMPEKLKNEEMVSRVIDIITAYLKDLSEPQLESVLNFAQKLNDEQEKEVLDLIRAKLRRMDILRQLKSDIEKQLNASPWKLQLGDGDRREEKIVLIILISTLHYSRFVLFYVRQGRDPVQEYLQSVNADEGRPGVVSLQQSGKDHFQKTKKGNSRDYHSAIADYTKALEKAPYHRQLYLNRAICYHLMDKFEECRTDAFRQYIIEPVSARAIFRWSSSLHALGHKEAAILVMEEGLNDCRPSSINRPTDIDEMRKALADFKRTGPKTVVPTISDAEGSSPRAEGSSPRPEGSSPRLQDKPLNEKRASSRDTKAKTKSPEPDEDKSSSDSEDLMPGLASVETDSDNDDFEAPVVDNDRPTLHGATSISSSSSASSMKEAKRKNDQKSKQPATRKKEPRVESSRTDYRNKPSSSTASASDSTSSVQDEFQKKLKLRDQFKEYMAEGSKSILSEVSRSAVTAYEKALEFLKNYDKATLQFSEMDEVILKYCMGLAHLYSGIEANITSAINAFTSMVECEGKKYLFAYLGLGKAYRKLNFFHKAISWVEVGLLAVNNGVQISGGKSFWPGTSTVIAETDEGKLKELLTQLLFECKNPEHPEARCGFEKCEEEKRDIYFTDIPFSGFLTLQCKEHCKFNFHRNCWMKYKGEKNMKSNKEFLGKECPTPDCAAIVIEFLSIDHTTTVKSREILQTTEETKTVVKKTKAKERAQPSAENLRRKLERKEEKKRQKMAAKLMSEELAEGATAAKEVEEEREVVIPDMEEMVVLKSKTDDDDDVNKVSKKKKHKNKEKDKNKPQNMNIEIKYTDQSTRALQSENNLPRFLNQDSPPVEPSHAHPTFPSASYHQSTPPPMPYGYGSSVTPPTPIPSGHDGTVVAPPPTSYGYDGMGTPPPPPSTSYGSPPNSTPLSSQDSGSGSSILNHLPTSAVDEVVDLGGGAGSFNPEPSGEQVVESIIVWCQGLIESRGPILISDMDPHLSGLGIEAQTLLADLGGLTEVLVNDQKRRCRTFKDANKLDYIYYTPEQFSQAQKLYLETKKFESEIAAAQHASSEDTLVLTSEASASPSKTKDSLSAIASLLLTPNKEKEMNDRDDGVHIKEEAKETTSADVQENTDDACVSAAIVNEDSAESALVPTYALPSDHSNYTSAASNACDGENLVQPEKSLLNKSVKEETASEPNNGSYELPKGGTDGGAAAQLPVADESADARTKLVKMTTHIDEIKTEFPDDAQERLADLEMAALKALVAIVPTVISIGNLHFQGSSEQMTITQAGISIILSREKIFRPGGKPSSYLTDAWPIRLQIDMKVIKRVIGRWKEEPYKLFFSITSAGGKSVNDRLGLVKFSEDVERPQFNPDSYDNRFKWIMVTFSHPSGLNDGFEVIFKYASSSYGYGMSTVGPSLLRHFSAQEANALHAQVISSMEDVQDSFLIAGAQSSTNEKNVSKGVGTSITLLDMEKLEGYRKLANDLELKEKNYEIEINRMRDDLKKKDTEKKKVDKEIVDSKTKLSTTLNEVADLHQKKSEMEKKLQNKISEKEKELTGFRVKTKDLEQSITSRQTALDEVSDSQKVTMKEYHAMVRRWLLQAIEDYSHYEEFVEERMNELESGNTRAKDKLKQLVKESNEKKEEYSRSLAQVDLAIKAGRGVPEELKKLTNLPRVIIDYAPILNSMVEHHVSNVTNNNNNDATVNPLGRQTASAGSIENELTKSSRSVSLDTVSNAPKNSQPAVRPVISSPSHGAFPPSQGPYPAGSANMVYPHMMGMGPRGPMRGPFPPNTGPRGHGYGPFGQSSFGIHPGMPPQRPPMMPPQSLNGSIGSYVGAPRGTTPPRSTPPPPSAVAAAPATAPTKAPSKDNNMLNKLIANVQARHPEVHETIIRQCINEFRQERGSLSGMVMSELKNTISERVAERIKPVPALATRYVKPAHLEDRTRFTGSAAGEECAICLSELNSEEIYNLKECNHQFHRRCIKKWLREKSTCPLCQKHIKLDEDFPALNG